MLHTTSFISPDLASCHGCPTNDVTIVEEHNHSLLYPSSNAPRAASAKRQILSSLQKQVHNASMGLSSRPPISKKRYLGKENINPVVAQSRCRGAQALKDLFSLQHLPTNVSSAKGLESRVEISNIVEPLPTILKSGPSITPPHCPKPASGFPKASGTASSYISYDPVAVAASKALKKSKKVQRSALAKDERLARYGIECPQDWRANEANKVFYLTPVRRMKTLRERNEDAIDEGDGVHYCDYQSVELTAEDIVANFDAFADQMRGLWAPPCTQAPIVSDANSSLETAPKRDFTSQTLPAVSQMPPSPIREHKSPRKLQKHQPLSNPPSPVVASQGPSKLRKSRHIQAPSKPTTDAFKLHHGRWNLVNRQSPSTTVSHVIVDRHRDNTAAISVEAAKDEATPKSYFTKKVSEVRRFAERLGSQFF